MPKRMDVVTCQVLRTTVVDTTDGLCKATKGDTVQMFHYSAYRSSVGPCPAVKMLDDAPVVNADPVVETRDPVAQANSESAPPHKVKPKSRQTRKSDKE